MKNLAVVLSVFLSSSLCFAQTINLPAGNSVVIGGELVTCQGPSEPNLPPACSIRQDGSSYHLYAGSTIAETFYSFSDAVAGAKKMKDAGLCR